MVVAYRTVDTRSIEIDVAKVAFPLHPSLDILWTSVAKRNLAEKFFLIFFFDIFGSVKVW